MLPQAAAISLFVDWIILGPFQIGAVSISIVINLKQEFEVENGSSVVGDFIAGSSVNLNWDYTVCPQTKG